MKAEEFLVVVICPKEGHIYDFVGVYSHLIRAEIIRKWAEHLYPGLSVSILKNTKMKKRSIADSCRN